MKLGAIIFCLFSFILLLLQAGCEPSESLSPVRDALRRDEPMPETFYVPAKAHILPLTEIIHDDDAQGQSEIKICVSLLDSFGSQMKAPAVFRFELYECVQRSVEPKGRRIAIWPDIDLTESAENNKYWRDFLRAYEFNLPFEPEGDKSYIIQATCLCPNGKRLSAEFNLKHTK